MSLFTKEEALRYHSAWRTGKLEVVPVKPCRNQKDLSLAYSPGVALACLEIKDDPNKGLAIHQPGESGGRGHQRHGSARPRQHRPPGRQAGHGRQGRAVQDLRRHRRLRHQSWAPRIRNKSSRRSSSLEPTFGAINLEDIKAPECFEIERRLIESMNIPVFHDDQHGTAIISGAGILNAVEISGKRIEDLKVVVSGAGAAAIACSRFYVALGVDPANIAMFDSKGHIHAGRQDLHPTKAQFAQKKAYASLGEALKGADVFLGLSTKGLVSPDMVRGMASHPIIFAMANPDPEISYDDAKKARPDAIMGTGRSDCPNQVNNVSGFPYIFRGALDVGAKKINREMQMAAAKALAALAKEPVPTEVLDMYGVKELTFGIDYVIPKALDGRMLEWESPAVAQAAMDTGVAQRTIDLDRYKLDLRERISAAHKRIETYIASYHLDF